MTLPTYSRPQLVCLLLSVTLAGSLASDAVVTGFLELSDDSSSDNFDFGSVTVSLLDKQGRVVG